ncbi:MAG: hypothetical protein FWG99_10485 [Treponema sp.]|nr:hypothetical protein [Treponema sp.]
MGNSNDFGKMINISSIFGILVFLTTPITVVLYFMYSGTPPVWNVLLRTLVAMFSLLFVLIFFTCFQELIKHLVKENNWIIKLMYNTVCIYIAISFVARSLEAGGVLNPEGIAVDATQDGLLAQGNYLLLGSISRLLMATFMTIIGILTNKIKIFPKWAGLIAIIIGLINLSFIPSMFFGTNAGDFYSAIGWGNSAFSAGLYTIWILLISMVLIKNKKKIENEYE